MPFHLDKSTPAKGEVFVFSSNLGGRHNLSSALVARKYFGAVNGKCEGYMGKPPKHSYAIPTKDACLVPLPLEDIAHAVERFKAFCEEHPGLNFFIVRIGCGISGYADSQIAPLFLGVPEDRCSLPAEWREFFTERSLKEE